MPRINHLDTAKFILICLVIFGHILEKYMAPGSIELSVFNIIFLFDMPAFVIMSGYFTSSQNPLKGLRNILQVLLIFQVIHTLLVFVLYHKTGIDFLYIPQWTLWYLVSLTFWRLMIYALKSFSCQTLLLISVLLCLLAPFLSIDPRPFSWLRTLSFFPFFCIGYALKQTSIQKVYPNFYLSLISFLLLSIISLIYPTELRWLINWATPYADMPIHIALAPFCRLVTLLIALYYSFCFFSITTHSNNQILQTEGPHTLFYYMYHSILILISIHILYHFHIHLTLFTCLLLALVIITVIFILRRIPFLSSLFRK